jgi:predicted nucleic acid binding AN1-type Zn finger protein
MILNPEPKVEKEKKRCTRCSQCKKKLGLMEYTCKCEKQFCISHLQPQEHACTFNYKAEADVALIKHLESEQRASKFEKI